jgi:catechol 2,3-dioxygenase-like lactoylglutathione lyase family enzyme
MRLRQVVLAASDLAVTRTLVEDELGLPHVWADPGVAFFGLRNALYAIGDTFLEVVSPMRDDAPARRFIDRAGGDAGYMAIVQTTDPLDEVRARADALDVRVVFTAEGDGVTGLHLHPADTDGTLLSIDRCDDERAWPWAGPAWDAAPDRGYRGITGATFAVDSPREVAERWAALLGTDAAGDTIALDGSTLRFVPRSRGASGLCAMSFAGPPRPPITVAGVELTVD